MTLKVVGMMHLHRFIIKSEYAKLYIPEIEFEIPPQTQKGSMSTLEGILKKSIEDLMEMQEERRKVNKDLADKIDAVIAKLDDYSNAKLLPFTVVLYDPSGNSFIQNPNAPQQDAYLKAENFHRTKEQLIEMGFEYEGHIEETKEAPKFTQKKETIGVKPPTGKKEDKNLILSRLIQGDTTITEEYVSNQANFDTACYACTKEGQARSCTVNIPYFKELIIMSYVCEYCGYHSVETQSGGGISEKGTIYTFQVKGDDGLNRELFKSNSCSILIPELDLDMSPGTIPSLFSTVEGLLEKLYNTIEQSFPFAKSDSSPELTKNFLNFCNKFNQFRANGGFTLILKDPLSNTFIQNPFEPSLDPLLKKEIYERSKEENDDLGISDMKV